MSDIRNMYFRRAFSLTMFKNKKIELCKMTFDKDFVNTKRGDLYPVIEKEGKSEEKIFGGKYHFSSGENALTVRLFGHHFPYATYEISPEVFEGACGFSLIGEGKRADILFSLNDGKISARCNDEILESSVRFVSGCSFIATCRVNQIDIYIKEQDCPEYIGTFTVDSFGNMAHEKEFMNTKACLFVSGNTVISSVSSYIDCGVSQADIRPIRYENGEIIRENGKIFLTMSVRLQEQAFQGIFTWVPGTCEFEFAGALFFDCGDGVWGNYVASSILYNRMDKNWYVWVSSFAHSHILAYTKTENDFRFGVNVIDVTIMDKMTEKDADTDFLGKYQDEDPDLIYDEEKKKWYMTICRIVNENGNGNYHYFLFESNEPFSGYKCIGNTKSGAETGGSIIKTDEGFFFVCGNGFDKRAEYRIYKMPDMESFSLIKCDYDDGGFRGWGTVMPIKTGTRTKYYWLTFDRHGGSNWTWSYGNIYGFVAE